jgi:tripartite-type tricarboxylate transporter receptor subunit TctC
MLTKRAIVFGALAAAGLIAAATAPTGAQSYPTKPIKMIVPFPPGGPIDSIGRLIGQHMTRSQFITLLLESGRVPRPFRVTERQHDL